MPDQIDIETSLHLFRVFARAFRSVMDCTSEDIRSRGLPPTEFAVLELLYHKGPQSLQQVGDKILRSSGSVTYVIDKLEQNGLLVRQPDCDDRRVTRAALTDAGRQIMDDVFPAHARRICECCAALDEAEQRQLIQLLKKLGLGAAALGE